MGSIFSNLRRDEDEAWVADYGSYTLHSALQPIFSQVSPPGLRTKH